MHKPKILAATGAVFLIVVIIALSFVLNLVSVQGDSSAAFYSPLTRFWELLTGSLLAYASTAWHSASEGEGWPRLRALLNHPVTTPGAQQLKNAMSILGMALLIAAITCLNSALLFPGWWALLPTLGALLVIAAGPRA